MSSYLAFRYIERDDVDFYPGMQHRNFSPLDDSERKEIYRASEIGDAINLQVSTLQQRVKKIGVMLSGGMDSAIVASYAPGTDAYTFRFLGGAFQEEELSRAEYYAKTYGLKLHYVDISWETVEKNLDRVMARKGAPVHSIEPQILQAAEQALNDGVDMMLVGESSDLVFGGMDGLLAKDWTFDEFVHRYTFTDPSIVLTNPTDMRYLYERYRVGEKIDFQGFLQNVFSVESSGSYMNAFAEAGLAYFDPYASLKMAEPLDLKRVRNGEPKYLVRELMAMRYPDIPVPSKVPMPRPVDSYFSSWQGPQREEFRKDIQISDYSGNQKWQLWCLERFLDIYEPQKCED
jgi:asparagine synthetase B (glutamine-hydrolysing)